MVCEGKKQTNWDIHLLSGRLVVEVALPVSVQWHKVPVAPSAMDWLLKIWQHSGKLVNSLHLSWNGVLTE